MTTYLSDDAIFDRTISRINGVVIGIVTDNKDPDKLGRVKVKLPWLKDSANDQEDFETDWCRLVQFYAGTERGSFIIPEIDDEVLVAFGHGDIRFPYIIGSLYNGVDVPPGYKEDFEQGDYDANDHKIWETRCGHRLVFDDSGKGRILLIDSSKNNYILIDSDKDEITIEAKTGNINMYAKNNQVNIEAKEINIKSSENTNHEIGADYNVKNTGSLTKFQISSTWTIEVGSKMQTKVPTKTVECTNLTISSNTNSNVKVGGTADLQIAMAQIKTDVMQVQAGQESGTYGMLQVQAGQIAMGSQSTLAVKGVILQAQGGEVAMAGNGMASVKGAMVECTASGPVALQGAMVQLN
ncbi:MAG: hypothetical protein KC609_00295 [Myxococcales bacterium]|nr:hypothetical protein [Myxococcales bacterium]